MEFNEAVANYVLGNFQNSSQEQICGDKKVIVNS